MAAPSGAPPPWCGEPVTNASDTPIPAYKRFPMPPNRMNTRESQPTESRPVPTRRSATTSRPAQRTGAIEPQVEQSASKLVPCLGRR